VPKLNSLPKVDFSLGNVTKITEILSLYRPVIAIVALPSMDSSTMNVTEQVSPAAGKRTIAVEKRKRGIFGWIVAAAFWLWNLLMVAWLVGGLNSTTTQYSAATSEAARTGTAVGTAFAVTFMLIIWAMGTIILGALMMFTRGKKTIITQVVD
jgi:hypothetical protein